MRFQNVIWTSNEENESVQAIEKLKNDNEALRKHLNASQEQSDKLTRKVEQVPSASPTINFCYPYFT